MIEDPTVYGAQGHKLNQILPTITIGSYDLSKLTLDPVPPTHPSKPTEESILASDPVAPKASTKELSKSSRSKSSTSGEGEGKEEEGTASTSVAVTSSAGLSPSIPIQQRLKIALEKYEQDCKIWAAEYKVYLDDITPRSRPPAASPSSIRPSRKARRHD